MKKLLVTGANGFVGSHLVEMALANNYEVFAAVRKNSDLSFLENTKAALVYPDYFNQDKLINFLRENGITHIAHVAGVTKAKSEEDYYKINAHISVNLANAALQANKDLKKFVFISSLSVTGPAQQDEILTENTAPHPVTFYGKSKLFAEEELSKIENLPLISLRPTTVYGPREKDLLIMIKMIKKGWELYIGKTPQRLNFIYVDDLCNAILLALESPKNKETYLLSDGKNYDRYELANVLKNIFQNKTFKLHIPASLIKTSVVCLEKMFPRRNSILNKNKLQELTSNWECSIEKAEKELNYLPEYDLQKGMEQTISWLQENKWI